MNVLKVGIFLLALSFGVGAVCGERLENCKRQYESLAGNGAGITEKTLNAWLELEPECSGTGFYEYHLAKMYIALDRPKKARLAIEQGLKSPSEFEDVLHLAKGDVPLYQHDYESALVAYENTMKRYPDWYLGYSRAGLAAFAAGDNDKSVRYLEKANTLQESADAYRNLTLAYYVRGKHEKAVEALNRAFSMDDGILKDRDPMLVGVRSYAELGEFQLSRKLLELMLSENPDIKYDEQYIKSGLFVRKKMIDAGLLVKGN
ncbi:hypothetical protein EB809_18460 [Marinobacter sp. R17]|uniref:tetratricopeptide repeat protein n=1 Tax=Marinobacter sp. R17 TaxID=2484250 RepID=UPI000F4CB34A|nr:hypothetical protein [Marinobacter sp. R17]ROT95810.1 hypothetical protein EB809_18460 [Marinobacter sp. R17]